MKSNLTDRMNNLIGDLPAKKKAVEQKLENVGRQIRKNVDQGDADLKAGKIGRYDTINPLKGTVKAFKDG